MGRARGGERGAGGPPGLARAPGPPPKPALRLACHEAAVARAAAAAGAAVAAAAGASRGALPGALQLPARRRPALPRPAGRPHRTVSTRRPAPAPSLAPGHLVSLLWPSLPGSLEKKASSYQIPPFKVVRRQSLGTVFANQCHALGGSPITAHPAASGGPRPAISRFTRLGLRQGAWNCPEATEGEGQLPAAAGRGSVVMLLNSSCLCL